MMDFGAWVQRWMVRHPVKTLPASERERFAAEVMARVRALRTLDEPVLAPVVVRPRLTWPQFSLAAVGLVAVVAMFLTTAWGSGVRLARRIDREIAVLAAVEESELGPVVESDPDVIADELEVSDEMLLAESATVSDGAWVHQTLELLEQLDDAAEGAAGDDENDDWLEELELLDDAELTASS